MCGKQSNALQGSASETILSYQLGIDKVELILIALNALYELKSFSSKSIEQILADGQKTFSIDTLPVDISNRIAALCDELYEPIHHIKYPLTPNDYLMQVDIDVERITEAETQNIIDDIEMTHGKVDLGAL